MSCKQGRKNDLLKLSKFFCRWITQLLAVVWIIQYDLNLLFSSSIAILTKAEILAKKLKKDFTELIENNKQTGINQTGNDQASFDWSIPWPGFDSNMRRHPVTSSKDRD